MVAAQGFWQFLRELGQIERWVTRLALRVVVGSGSEPRKHLSRYCPKIGACRCSGRVSRTLDSHYIARSVRPIPPIGHQYLPQRIEQRGPPWASVGVISGTRATSEDAPRGGRRGARIGASSRGCRARARRDSSHAWRTVTPIGTPKSQQCVPNINPLGARSTCTGSSGTVRTLRSPSRNFSSFCLT
jgi:hypothetical protein